MDNNKKPNTYFYTDKDGNKLYFPWGAYGRGYIVSTKEQEDAITHYQQDMLDKFEDTDRYNVVNRMLSYALQKPSHIKKLTEGMERSPVRLKAIEAASIDHGGKTLSLPLILFFFTISLTFTIASILMAGSGHREDILLPYAAILFFGFCAVNSARMVIEKITQRKTTTAIKQPVRLTELLAASGTRLTIPSTLLYLMLSAAGTTFGILMMSAKEEILISLLFTALFSLGTTMFLWILIELIQDRLNKKP